MSGIEHSDKQIRTLEFERAALLTESTDPTGGGLFNPSEKVEGEEWGV